jgi:hypothetical protein
MKKTLVAATIAIATAAAPSIAGPLVYFGGPVIENAKVYVVWWGPASQLSPFVTNGDMAAFFSGIVNSPYVDFLNEYDTDISVQGGSRTGAAGTNQHIGRGNFAGVYELLDVPPGNVTDATVQSTLLAAITRGDLPAADANAIYGIFFPAAMHVDNSCQRGGFEGYHFATGGSADGVEYMVFPDCGFTLLEDFTGVTSHELGESITDRAPTPGDIPDYPQAWNDSKAFEIADVCDNVPLASAVTPVATFIVEPLWDNASNGCSVTHAFAQDYNLELDPNVVDLRAGQTVSIAVHTATVNGGPQPLALSVSAPAGITGSFDQGTVTSGGTATLTLTASPAVPFARDSQVIVTALGTNGAGPQHHTASLLLQPAEFTLVVGKAHADLPSGGSTTVPITVTTLHGDPGAIDLSISGLPRQVTGTFSTIAAGASTLTLKASGAAAVTNATFVVTAKGATATHSGTGLYTVVPSGGCATSGDGFVLLLAALATLAARRHGHARAAL